MEVGENLRRSLFLEGIVGGIKYKLTKWSGKHLTFAGKEILLKYVVSSLPLFYFSFYKLPIKVEKTFKRIQRKFL